jgi:(p)ppGpp synthase/HD superfamily hydrolase
MEKIQKALIKAYDVHKGFRKGTDFPYFLHILDVAKYLMFETKDEDVICAGILHDTLEDSSYTKEELINDFGLNVFNYVNFSTEPENTIDKSSNDMIKSWKIRKQNSIDKIKSGKYEELLVYTADKLSNITNMQEDLIFVKNDYWKRFNASKEDIGWYYKSILNEIEPKLKDTRLFHLFRKRVLEVFG